MAKVGATKEITRNIDLAVFESWQDKRYRGIYADLVEFTGLSRPTISVAINRGYIHALDDFKKIDEFFKGIKKSKK